MIQINILLVLMAIVLLLSTCSFPTFADTPAPGPENKQSLTCQYATMNITCEPGSYIDVIMANYGRISDTLCKSEPIHSTDCGSKTSLEVVRTKCNNQQNCIVPASNDIFGNPCVNTTKYLDVRYQCIPKPIAKKALTCEGSNMDIKCEAGEAVSALSANYGQTASKICKDGALIDRKDCFSSNGKEVVSNYCSSNQNCSIPVNSQVFKDPCEGTSKYLEAEWECIKSQKQSLVCQYSSMTLKCNPGFVVDVIRATYGRQSNTTCASHKLLTTDCASTNSFEIVRTKCTNKQSCDISATNDVFGNPCINTIKYLDVEHRCILSK